MLPLDDNCEVILKYQYFGSPLNEENDIVCDVDVFVSVAVFTVSEPPPPPLFVPVVVVPLASIKIFPEETSEAVAVVPETS